MPVCGPGSWLPANTGLPLQSRRQVNELDNLTTGKAVDALLNYETVKLFNNEQLEVGVSPHLKANFCLG